MKNIHNQNLIKSACLINGEWRTAKSGETIDVFNPFNNEKIADVPSLSTDEVKQAIEYAYQAKDDWAKKTASERAEILHKWADLIDENKDDLARLMTLEQGKPIKEATGEITYANSFIRWFAEEGKRTYGDTIPTTNADARYVVIKQPIGVCAAITPWNFPAAMITRKVAPALAAGCPIIVKPAGLTPLSALALGELAVQAGIPNGVLQIVTGKASDIGNVLSTDERIKKLSFTGSTEVGRTLMAQSADTIKKLSMELGGNAPFIVFDDANLEKAVDGLIASKFRNAGQTCVCANRIYVQSGIYDEFIEIFTQKVKNLKIGNGLDKDTDIAVLVNQDGLDKAQRLLDSAVKDGATIITGGQVSDIAPLLFEPTVVVDVKQEMDIVKEEIFAPIAAIAKFETEEEVIKLANDTIFGLASYFYTNDLARSWRVMESLEYGIVGQNTGLISNEVVPFGGAKQSGFGREGSKYGIEDYLEIKYWNVNIG